MIIEDTIHAEGAERAALADLHGAALPETRDSLGLELTELGGALVSIARHHPTILVNRVVGLGLVDAADRETVKMIVERYREAGVGRYFLQLDPAATPEKRLTATPSTPAAISSATDSGALTLA